MATYENKLVNLIVNDVRTENLEATLASFDEFEKKLSGLARSAVGQELGQSFKNMTEEELKAAGVLDQIKAKEQELYDLAVRRVEQEKMHAEVAGGGTGARASVGYIDSPQLSALDEKMAGLATTTNAAAEAENNLALSLQQSEQVLTNINDAFRQGQISEEQYAEVTKLIRTDVEQYGRVSIDTAAAVEQLTGKQIESAELLSKVEAERRAGTQAATELQAQNQRQMQQSTMTIETYDQAIQALQRDTNNIIRQADELSAQQVRLIDQWASGGKSLEQMRALAQGANITFAQLKQTLLDLGYEIEKTGKAGDKWNAGLGDQIRTARGMRYTGLELMGVMSMLSIAMGEQLPASMRELEKSTMLITSGALATAMLGIGAVPGLIIGGILALGTAMTSVDQATQDLNKSLDSMAKKDEIVDTMSKLLIVSRDEAQALYDIAKNSPEAASGLRKVVDNVRELSAGEMFLGSVAGGLKDIGGALGGLGGGIANTLGLSDAWKEVAKNIQVAWDDLRGFISASEGRPQAALEGINEAISAQQALTAKDAIKEHAKEDTEALKAQEQQTKSLNKASDDLFEGYVKAGQTFNEANERALDSLNNAMAQASQQRSDEFARLANQAHMEAERSAEAWRKIQDTLRDAEEKAWQTYNDRVFDINQKRQDKLDDLAYDYSHRQTDEQNARLKREEELSDKLYQIERDRIEALANLDFDTAMQLSKAKTENDKDEIMYRAMHEREQINQKAMDQIEDLMRKQALDEADASKRKKDLEEEYAHRKAIVEREYVEELMTAKRTYEEQRKAAIDSFNDQVAAQRFAEQQQAEARAFQAAQIEQRYKEQSAAAQQRYATETKAAQQRYDDEKAALNQRYDDEVKRIQETYKEKIDAIQKEWEEFVKVHDAKMQALNDELTMIKYGAAFSQMTGTYIPSAVIGAPGGQNGLDMVVPPGFQNDSFLLRASSGEHVSISPSQSGSKQTVNISVEPALAPIIQSLMGQMVNNQVFRQGVELVLNDAIFQG